ncbi:12487_t:CDS:2, partial [Acaulospora colombiana]
MNKCQVKDKRRYPYHMLFAKTQMNMAHGTRRCGACKIEIGNCGSTDSVLDNNAFFFVRDCTKKRNGRVKSTYGISFKFRLPFLPGGAIEYNHIPVLYVCNKNLIQIPPNPRNPLEVQLDYPYVTIKEEVAGFTPPTDLVNWLNDGNKPIYFGYGSMHSFSDSVGRVKLWLKVLDKLPELHRACKITRTTSGHSFRSGFPSWTYSSCLAIPTSCLRGTSWRCRDVTRRCQSGSSICGVLTDEKIQERAEELGRKIRSEHTHSPISNIVSFIEQYWDREKWDVMTLYDNESTMESWIQDEESNEPEITIKEDNLSDVAGEKANESDDSYASQPLIVSTRSSAFEVNGKRMEESIMVPTKIEVENIM